MSTALSAPYVLGSALDAPPAAALTNALAAGGSLFSVLTDTSIVIYCLRHNPDKLIAVTTIACADGPEAHAWAIDGSLFALASSRRLQVS